MKDWKSPLYVQTPSAQSTAPPFHFQGQNSLLRKDDNVRLAPDLALVAGEPERMKHYPRLWQFAAETLVYVALAVGAVLGYVRNQDGQFSPPIASLK